MKLKQIVSEVLEVLMDNYLYTSTYFSNEKIALLGLKYPSFCQFQWTSILVIPNINWK